MTLAGFVEALVVFVEALVVSVEALVVNSICILFRISPPDFHPRTPER
jgi:hypothetical protein